jgi:stage II sporulation protein D
VFPVVKKVMNRKLFYITVFLILNTALLSGQVKVRLLTGFDPDTVVFSVTAGEYALNSFKGKTEFLRKGDTAIITKSDEKLTFKTSNTLELVSDSLLFSGHTGNDTFSLSGNEKVPAIRYYSGELQCKPDLGTLLLINTCDIESYIAGVVETEGGHGKNAEYFKTQAVIARTYMYRHLEKHILDGFNLCDNTHCQAFNGLTSDSVIIGATLAAKGLVILGADSTLIISAFHSNCGGETLSSENVWLTGQPYLKKVTDNYCTSSRNAKWRKSISISDWLAYLRSSGLSAKPGDLSQLNFSQITRLKDYKVGTFSIPLIQIRSDLGLRSAFFSVKVEGDSVILNGRGYGHGVGLCQEGAITMASQGFDFRKIIEFYYKGVIISPFYLTP